jgi:hypothetical protein
MAKTAAERQKAYRARQKKNTHRIAVTVFLDSDTHHALNRLCDLDNSNQAAVISAAIKQSLRQRPSIKTIPVTEPLDLTDFANTIQQITNQMTTGLFGPKVFINHVWHETTSSYQWSLNDFKDSLLKAHQKRLLTLAREDMPSQHDTSTLMESKITYLNACYHYIRQTITHT